MNTSLDRGHAVAAIVRENMLLGQAILNDAQLLACISQVAQQMINALKSRRKIFFFGNGGSAADAQHLAAELVGRFARERRALAAIALTTDTSALTAISNDYSYESIFARQLEALASPGDIAVGISTSGRSPNVLNGICAAKKAGLVAVGMTGHGGGELARSADYCIRIPSDRTPRIQEAHILVGHILCEIVDQHLTEKSKYQVDSLSSHTSHTK